MSFTRTTFFTAEITGPSIPASVTNRATFAGTDAEFDELLRLQARTSTIRAGHRRGHWSAEALQRLAQRAGVVIKAAESVPRDTKGFLNSCASKII